MYILYIAFSLLFIGVLMFFGAMIERHRAKKADAAKKGTYYQDGQPPRRHNL